MAQSLHAQLRSMDSLKTDIGEFIFKEQIGSGGNSTVFLFERNGSEYAIKFLTITDDKRKEKRFIDEYFALAQIPSHANILPQYHFDKIKVGEQNYYIIISKKFQFSLKKYKQERLNEMSTNEDKLQIMEKIFYLTCEGISHLHKNAIIHRDLKPENIYINLDGDNIKELVIGDFGIAHFDESHFDRLSETRDGERLANYKFSAPEQSEPGKTISFSSDIFALGQIMQWLISGTTHHGTSRAKICSNHPFFDMVIDKCLRNDSSLRYQSIDEIKASIKSVQDDRKTQKEQAEHETLVWNTIHDLDEIIRQTCTQIINIETLDNPVLIEEFLNNFNKVNIGNNFWCMNARGGDLHAPQWIKEDNDIWFMNNNWNIECNIEKIHIYRDDSIYKNFFVIQTKPLPLFQYEAMDGTIIERDNLDYYEDCAVFFQGKCIDPNETKNGFYRDGFGKSHQLTIDNHIFRRRIITKFAFMVAPIDTPINLAPQNICSDFIKSVLNSDYLSTELVNNFYRETSGAFRNVIKYNL